MKKVRLLAVLITIIGLAGCGGPAEENSQEDNALSAAGTDPKGMPEAHYKGTGKQEKPTSNVEAYKASQGFQVQTGE